MKLVRIIKSWDWPDLFRQTPLNKGEWGNYKFTTDEIRECDYVLVMNYSCQTLKIQTYPENVWCVQQEPHNEYFAVRHKYASKIYSRVFTTDPTLKGQRFVHSHGCLPWHINKNYNELSEMKITEKSGNLSCITSSKANFAGQKKRLDFLENLRSVLDLDVYGYGINPLSDKWNALAPYKYSLVMENFSAPDYWSEKIADCFLSWTVPIYYGCKNITDYFPKESLIIIDINDPDAPRIISRVIKTDLWKKNMNAIAHARKLILEKYQFFPFFSSEIQNWEKTKKFKNLKKEQVIIPDENTLTKNIFLNLMRLREKFSYGI